MIFQKPVPKMTDSMALGQAPAMENDEVETVVGPSVNVEGDFVSEGNIIVKGSVTGSVATTKHLLVEAGARIMANVRAGSVKIAGEVKGNMKVREALELTSTAKVLGDVEAKILVIEAGALLYGKVAMPGIEGADSKITRSVKPTASKKIEDTSLPAVNV